MASEALEKAGFPSGEKGATEQSTVQPEVKGDPKIDSAAPVTEPTVDFSKVNDDDLIRILSERTGNTFSSLEDFKPKPAALTEEDKQKAVEKRKLDIHQFALDKKLYDSKVLESYIADKAKDPRVVAFEAFKEDVLKGDAKAKDEDIQNMFDILYADETEEDKGWVNTHKQSELQKIAAAYLSKKYENLQKAEDEYDKYEKSIQAESELKQAAQVYRTTVDKVATSFNPLEKVTIDDGAGNKEEISYNIPVETINATREEFLNSDTFKVLQKANVSQEAIQMAFQDTVRQKEFPKMVTEFARSYHSVMVQKEKMGRRGIPVTTEQPAAAEAANKGSEVLGNALASLTKR